jgi:predicted 3-demethylubiquinone-9 3-methyltransferase (glyoxalase superfamily)
MTQLSVLPFLMFQGDGSAALDFYRSVFPDVEVNELRYYGPGEPGKEGSIKRARFAIGGQSVLCTDSYVKHGFSFTPSFSFFVECNSEEQIRSLSSTLKEGGAELMPIASYGFSKLFAWVTDRFGVAWQLNYA